MREKVELDHGTNVWLQLNLVTHNYKKMANTYVQYVLCIFSSASYIDRVLRRYRHVQLLIFWSMKLRSFNLCGEYVLSLLANVIKLVEARELYMMG